jgi:DEAD/DEAH box helicase domain-containing protein
MGSTVVLDLETKKLFSEVKNGKHSLLGISVCGIYESETDTLRAFEEEELGGLWPILENAKLIVGYNIKKFDYQVLASYYKGNIFSFPTLDLYEIVRDILGFSLKLDDLAHATLGIHKIGTGLDAVRLFNEGKIDELKKYCLHDVKITNDLYHHAVRHGHLKFYDFGQVLKTFPVDIANFAPKANKKTQMSLGV